MPGRSAFLSFSNRPLLTGRLLKNKIRKSIKRLGQHQAGADNGIKEAIYS